MKKNLFGWTIIVLMAFVCVGFAACSSDDDNNGSASGLIGNWKRIYKLEISYTKDESGQWKETYREEKTYDNREAHGFIFKSGNKVESVYFDTDGTYEAEDKYDFDYKIENNHLYLKSNYPGDTDGFEDWGTFSLSGSTFELLSEEIDGGYREIEVTRYKKQ